MAIPFVPHTMSQSNYFIRRRRHHEWLVTDPDGYIRDFGYDLMRRSYDGQEHNVVEWVRRQLRMSDPEWTAAEISHVFPHSDLANYRFLIPPNCPDTLADPERFWQDVQRSRLSDHQHLWAGPTVWFPNPPSQHYAFRRLCEFIQSEVVDRFNVPAFLVAHDPGQAARSGNYHVHVIVSVRAVSQHKLDRFVPELVKPGCQRELWLKWQIWAATKVPSL